MQEKRITRENLIDAVRVMGHFIADNAENFVPEEIGSMSYDKALEVSFHLSGDECPMVEVKSRFVVHPAVYELFKKTVNTDEAE